ncbi:MAG TPA: aminodeoxychorismate synthase component I [Candidatus Eisenbacteria bacterium]|nr:aminodeoxychorismate synthase component I [Candidatus Eisenbacteria bacterium]
MGTDALVAARAGVSTPPLVVRPLVRALPPEWTSVRALAAVGAGPYTLFFESGGTLGGASRWTLLAFDPVWRLTLRDGRLRRIDSEGEHLLMRDPMTALAEVWPARARYDPPPPGPFTSGLAGYLSYDLKDHLERYPSRATRDLDFPDLSLRYHDVVWMWDRETAEGWVVSTGLPEPDRAEREARAEKRLRHQWHSMADAMERIQAGSPSNDLDSGDLPVPKPVLTSNFTRDAYRTMVSRALEHIGAGDIYQVNLAQRFQVAPAPPALSVYRSLREIAPAPFLAFASLPNGGIASSSPERFFRVRGARIETWPIKGTRPRGATAEDDAHLVAELRASAKDRAENVMIVDLERNDLGRVCEVGSVAVPALCDVATHSNVHHLESRVEGRLRADASPVDVIRALFPGGSITGAPKIRAVEIIDELEPVRRGVYTGAIGYWDDSGDCDWNIAIRTISIVRGAAYFHAGGGIVADSTPEGEYEETLVKATGMMRALGVRYPREASEEVTCRDS